MAEANGPQKLVTLQEVVRAQMSESEALLNVLERKGLLTKVEVLDEARRLKAEPTKGECAALKP